MASSTSRSARSRSSSGYFLGAGTVPLSRGISASTKPGAVQPNGDNPFLRIEPGEAFDYLFRIPSDHPPGTHWYHPHHHGRVADQLFGGLAGALLVDGGPDLPIAADRVLLITDITLLADGNLAPVGTMDRMMGRQGDLVLVNGQHRPTLAAARGEAQRWRIVNACVSRVLPLRLDAHRLTQIAADGTFLPAPIDRDVVPLAPGNRADIVVRPGEVGRYDLLVDAVTRGGMGGMGGTAGSGPVTLATLVVDGPAAASPELPADLPAERPDLVPPDRARQVAFTMGMGIGGMSFGIDGREFDHDRTDQAVDLGTTEEWTITNDTPMDHPFHLHVWPFVVTATSSGGPPTGVPQDVVLVPARGWVRLRIAFTAHPGRSVYHCHILDHEDAGMMATIQVSGSGP